MPLPVIPLPTGEVTVGGETIPIRGLSRTEFLAIGLLGREQAAEAEAVMLSAGAHVSIEEARAWLGSTDPDTATTVLDAITALSGGPGSDGKDPKPPTNGR